MNKIIILFIFQLCVFHICMSQHHEHEGIPCGTDEMHQHLFENYPQYNDGIIRATERLKTFTENYKQQPNNRDGNPYIIPVVFHVIHNYGPENISDAQIFDAVEQVNIQMRKRNADTSEIVDAFKSIAADTEIEIRLAQIDPDGNCTNGITRSVSGTTMIGDHSVKDVIQWPPDKYLNIYVCNQAASLAGHALLPGAADTIPQWDGIVMQHSYVGTIGTSQPFRRTVVTHEIGHYLNLQHIWGGNNVPNFFYLPVAQASNCDHDDEVEDTPLTIGWQSCNLNGTSCGSLDNVQNYMDYAYCALMFTEGQKERMHACLNSPVANRNNLWTPENLAATGTDGQPGVLCQARIFADKQVVCVGETVTFSDISYNGITTRNWTISGGNITSSSDSTFQTSFSETGFYSVTLEVSDGTDNLSVTLEDYIQVIPDKGFLPGFPETFEYAPSFEERWIVENLDNINNWEITDLGYESNHSLMIDNFDLVTGSGFGFYSVPMDVSDLSEFLLTFDVAYARKSNNSSDILRIEVSTDCGETWSVRRNLSSSALSSVDQFEENEPFFPSSEADWKKIEVSTIGSNFLTDNLMIRFYFQSGGGNNLFIDNILMGHPNELNVNSSISLDNLKFYPNPANELLRIEGLNELDKASYLTIFDVTGRKVQQLNLSKESQQIEISLSNIEQGIYNVVLTTEKGNNYASKILIQR